MPDAETIVVGAGPAGLACAAALRRSGGSVIVLEKADRVAASWRHHYDRLHLHTHKRQSGLPGLPMPAAYPKYPSRDQLVAYLEDYAAHHRIAPRFGTTVLGVRQRAGWVVETDTATLTAGNVIFATGIAGWPLRPAWPGMDSFPGRLIHSSDYANPKPFSRCRVLVVGLGNSGGEIALDLCDAGNDVSLSVRSPVNVVPRDLLGIPILTLAILQRSLPYKLVDALNAPILRLAIGDLEPFGLRRPAKGPMTQVAEDGKIPLLDIGTIDRIRRGLITVRPGIARIRARTCISTTERARHSTSSYRRPATARVCALSCPIIRACSIVPARPSCAGARPAIPACSSAAISRSRPASCARSGSRPNELQRQFARAHRGEFG